MTLVVTHAHGFLGCFTQNKDGTMQQRALIDTGEEPPTPQALAELGTGLAVQYGWSLNGTLPPTNGRAIKERTPPELAAAERRAKDRERKRKDRVKRTLDRSDPPKDERMALIIDTVRQHPGGAMLSEIITLAGYEADQDRIGRWHHQMRELIGAGILVRERRHNGRIGQGSGTANYYTLAERPNENEEP